MIGRDGYLLASESRSKTGLSPPALVSLARNLGLIVLDAGGDIAVMTPESYSRFRSMLREVSTSDPEEASSRLGEYGRLFLLLRRKGSVYYDVREGGWRLLE